MEDLQSFAKVLVRTSPLTMDDIEDLRAAFDFFLHASHGKTKGYVEANQAAHVLRHFGLPNVELTESGGLVVQDPSKPKLLLDEQEFLLAAARLVQAEHRELLEGDLDMPEDKTALLRASRLFRSLDPNDTGKIKCGDLKFAVTNLGCSPPDLEAVSDLADHWAELRRYLDLPDDAPGFVTYDEFIDFAVPLILPTIPIRAVRYSAVSEKLE